jgi:hypothetical protein
MLPPRLRSQAIASTCLVVTCLALSACASRVDLKGALQVTDVSTGWFDAGIVDGKNKLVPSISFRLANTADADLDAVGLNVVFRLADTDEIHEEVFKQRVPFENKQTELIIVRSQNGFTGDPPQTRLEMLKHSLFRDMDVVIMARQTSAQWVELHRVRVERTLLTR